MNSEQGRPPQTDSSLVKGSDTVCKLDTARNQQPLVCAGKELHMSCAASSVRNDLTQ